MSLPVLCWSALGALAAVQLLCTLADRNRWPFVAQNMFSHSAPAVMPRLMVVLRDTAGGLHVAFPYQLLPVEFFRAQRILAQVYLEEEDEERQARFTRGLLQRLNEAPWRAFDEVETPLSRPPGARFSGLDLVLYDFHLDGYTSGALWPALGTPVEVLYSARLAVNS